MKRLPVFLGLAALLSSSQIFSDPVIFATSGQVNSYHSYPVHNDLLSHYGLISTSIDGGQNWTLVNVLKNAPDNYYLREFSNATCGEGMCFVIGTGDNLNSSGETTFIATSTDDINTWIAKPIQYLTDNTNSHFYFIDTPSCTGSKNNLHCVIPGSKTINNNTDTTMPIIVSSTDNGNTWKEKAISNYAPAKGTYDNLLDTSCTKGGKDALCVAIGTRSNYEIKKTSPFLVASTDGGESWQLKTLSYLSTYPSNYLIGSSCTDEGKNAFCVLLGLSFDTDRNTQTFMFTTTKSNNTWIQNTLPNLPAKYVLDKITCTGEKENAFCIAAGRANENDTQNYRQSFTVTSTDAGKSWSKPTLLDTPTDTVLDAIHCANNKSESICVAIINYGNVYTPSTQIFVSKDKGMTWENKKSISNSTLKAVSCANGQTGIVCSASGSVNAEPMHQPLIVSSIDQGNTWEIKNLPDFEDITGGFFNLASR